MIDLGVHVHATSIGPWWSAARSASSIWTRLPIEISYYHRRSFRELTNAVIASSQPAAVVSFFMRTAEYVRHRRDVPRILVAEDCRLLYQQRSRQSTSSKLQRLVRSFEVRQLRAYEPAVMTDFDVATFVTQTDIDAMTEAQPKGHYALLSNGVDLDAYRFRPDRESRTVLFAGKLNVEANHVMAMDLVCSIWPRVHTLVPDATLVIAGSFAKAELRRHMQTRGIEYVDAPASLEPLYHRGAVFAHPHRGGSGIQNKVLEAMATGCAVVTSPTGLQGIDAVNGVHAQVGTTHDELAHHIASLLLNPQQRDSMALEARRLMESTKSWDAIDEQLQSVLEIAGWKP